MECRQHGTEKVQFAEGGTRTHTLLRGPDFETGASANSATSARFRDNIGSIEPAASGRNFSTSSGSNTPHCQDTQAVHREQECVFGRAKG
jgi:hypothetical protein